MTSLARFSNYCGAQVNSLYLNKNCWYEKNASFLHNRFARHRLQ